MDMDIHVHVFCPVGQVGEGPSIQSPTPVCSILRAIRRIKLVQSDGAAWRVRNTCLACFFYRFRFIQLVCVSYEYV